MSKRDLLERLRRLTPANPFDLWTMGGGWRDEEVEIDVLALSGERPVIVGEAKCEKAQVGQREVAQLHRRAAALPEDDQPPRLAFWSMAGAGESISAAGHDPWIFTPADMF